jgi:hypothetical protein
MLVLVIASGLALARFQPSKTRDLNRLASLGVGLETVIEAGDAHDGARPNDPGGSQDRFGVRGTIGYTVRDAAGRVKLAGVIHNTVNNEAKNEVFNRIASTPSGGAFDGIAALSVSVGSDDPANGTLAGSITLNLDGDPGTPGNQNPADGTVTSEFGSDPGRGTISVTFTAKADSVSVKQIVLTKSAEDDTSVSNGKAIPDADIFAYVDVPDVTLNTNDTVQYTWTVNVD